MGSIRALRFRVEGSMYPNSVHLGTKVPKIGTT